jgi:DHA3 family macrolide efflux protein-like MFS transporter
LLHPAFTLLPILVTDHFAGGALQLGWLEAAAGIGIVAGGLLLSTWGGFRRRILTSLTGISSLGLSVLLLGLVPAHLFWLAIVFTFFVGLTIALTDGPLLAIVQAAVAPEMQGRVMTLLGSIAKLMAPLGLLIAGPAADLIGVRVWFLAAGIVALMLGLGGFFVPSLLQIEAVGAPHVGEAAAPEAVAEATV